jgi:hypothetical protein
VIDGTTYTGLSSLFQFQGTSDEVNVLAIVVAVDKRGSLHISDRSRAGITPTVVQGITLGTNEGKTNEEEAAADRAVNIAQGDCLLLRRFIVPNGKGGLACLHQSEAGTWCIRKPKGKCCAKCGRQFSEREMEEIQNLDNRDKRRLPLEICHTVAD